jgi:outer membrane protein assembly factor BamB
LGGLEWGSAVDENGIYTAVSNSLFMPHLMTTGPGAGKTVRGGFWAALDPATGKRKWEVAGNKPPAVSPFPAGAIALNTGLVSVANGVVFAGALDSLGTMYAFDAASGKILWSFESGGSVNSGAAIADGVVYWGSGYKNISGTPNNKLYAFESRTKDHHDDDKDIDTRQNELWATVAPNPVRNEKLNLRVSGQRGQTIQWEFRDMQGTILRSGKFDAQTDDQLQELNLSNATPGTYFIRVVSGTKITSIRLIKLE